MPPSSHKPNPRMTSPTSFKTILAYARTHTGKGEIRVSSSYLPEVHDYAPLLRNQGIEVVPNPDDKGMVTFQKYKAPK